MTMYVPAPQNEEIVITNLYGETMVQEEGPLLPNGERNPNAGKQGKVATATYQKFLLDRLADPKFLDKKEGIEAVELLHLARKQIFATKGKVGVHIFDSQIALRLQSCILHPSPKDPAKPASALLTHVSVEHNWIDWVRAWKHISEDPPAVLALEEHPGEPQGEES
jgi:hypothetical protein